MKAAPLLALAASLVFAACSLDAPKPAHAVLTATVTYAAGGMAQVSGTDGYWLIPGTLTDSTVAQPAVVIVARAGTASAGDTTHPALQSLGIQLTGASFMSLGGSRNLKVGAGATDSVAATALADSLAFDADSGTVTLTQLPNSYVKADFSLFFSRGTSQVFTAVGSLAVPQIVPLIP
ncbi:MAG TPA: hypothetical protein VGI92_09515 [Gemmatimonadales bacterium]